VKWGMTPAQAIQTATINAAESLNYDWSQQVGTIEKGKFADVIAVRGDPLRHIDVLREPKLVIKHGRRYK